MTDDLDALKRCAEVMTATRHQGGYLTVDRWPSYVRFDAALIASADPSHLRRDDDVITMHVANGRAVYCVVADDILTVSALACLESCWLQEPSAARVEEA